MWYIYTQLLEPDRISHTQSMVAKRGRAAQVGQTFIPQCEKVIENTERQNSNRSSDLGCNWTLSHSKNAGVWVWDDATPETRNRDFYFGLIRPRPGQRSPWQRSPWPPWNSRPGGTITDLFFQLVLIQRKRYFVYQRLSCIHIFSRSHC